MKKFLKLFFLCGIIGWCVEILFTSLQSLRRRDFTLMGTTSLWMFPIYGMASFLYCLYRIICKRSLFFRGVSYMLAIFSGEYLSGRLLAKKELCPWNYSRSSLKLNSFVRLDYAPLWFLLGISLEKLLFSRACQTDKT